MNLERDLSRALQRKPAPADLADRVLARLNEQPQQRGGRATASAGGRFAWLAAAAAVVMVAAGATNYYVEERRQAQAERAAQELQLALRITTETLAAAQRRVATSLQDDSQ